MASVLSASIDLLKVQLGEVKPSKISKNPNIFKRGFDDSDLEVLWSRLEGLVNELQYRTEMYERRLNEVNVELTPIAGSPFEVGSDGVDIFVKLNGEIIEGERPVDVYCNTLKSIGLDRIEKLNKKLRNYPLVSKGDISVGYQNYRKIDEWNLITHCATDQKIKLIEEIIGDIYGSK